MILTPKHLAFVLKSRPNELNHLMEGIDKYYYLKEEIKKDKFGRDKTKNGVVEKRQLYPSTGVLKILQRRINRRILSKLPLPNYAYGGIRAKDNISNALYHASSTYKFSTDIRNFFPSISHHRVYSMFRSHGFSPTVARTLTKLTTYKGMLPQGAPTSSTIANLVFAKTGAKLLKFSKENRMLFTSFIDDITISSNFDFKSKVREILDIVAADGYKISHMKTYYKTKDAIVTGLVLKKRRIALPENLRRKLTMKSEMSEAQIRGLQIYASRVEKSKIHFPRSAGGVA